MKNKKAIKKDKMQKKNILKKQAISKMRSETSTLVTFILDESGSMDTVRNETIEGFNSYINNLSKDEATTLVSLITFNGNGIDLVYGIKDIHDVDGLDNSSYRPRASTPLLDAVGEGVRMTEDYERNFKGDLDVIITILTDGHENSSREYTRSQISELIEKKQEEDWDFIFLASNQEAWASGEAMGVRAGYSRTYSHEDPQMIFNEVSESILNLKRIRRHGVRRPDSMFLAEEKRKREKTKRSSGSKKD